MSAMPVLRYGHHWAVVVIALLCATTTFARDRIVLQPPEKASRLTLSGDIADYNAETIEIHLTTGKPVHRYPASQVLSVETVQTEAHRNGVRLFEEGDLIAAKKQFDQALKDEPRDWVQREILGWQVKIALREGHRISAGQRFLQITALEPSPREYAVAPFVWDTVPVDARLTQQARYWLTGESPSERLLGASILLLDTKYGNNAKLELDRLARVSDARVALLARAQLWRLRVTSPDVTDNELRSWQSAIESMPAELRAGPYFTLGRAYLHRSEYDRAAAAFLWLTTVHHDHQPLTAAASIHAAKALKRVGRLKEATLLLNELATSHAETPVATEAQRLLDELTKHPAR